MPATKENHKVTTSPPPDRLIKLLLMLASRSLSPNRNRRHSIFSHSNSRKNLEGSAGSTFQLQQSLRVQAVAPSPMAL
jgi:hypothetical protein